MSVAQVVIVAGMVLLATGVQTVTGFGFALLAVPLMSLVIPTEVAVVVSASLGLLSSAGQAVAERHHGDRRTIAWLLGGALIGAPFGLVVLKLATDRQLRMVLVAVILVFLIVNLRGFTLERSSRALELGAGVVSGVLNSSLSTNGPPLVMALHPRHLPPPQFRGTLTAVMAASGLVTVGLFAASGRYTADVGVLLLAALPSVGLGFLIGVRHRHRVSLTRFRQTIVGLLVATAVVATISVLTA